MKKINKKQAMALMKAGKAIKRTKNCWYQMNVY